VKVKEHDDGSNCYCFVFSEVSELAFYYGLLNSRPHVLGMIKDQCYDTFMFKMCLYIPCYVKLI
jgi:hypothetical protein